MRREKDDGVTRNLGLLAALLDECVSFGTHVFSWLLESPPPVPPHRVVTALLFRGLIEALDNAAVLAKASCPEGVEGSLRAALEAHWNLLFILETDTERRAAAYEVAHAHSQLAFIRRRDLSTKEGRETKEAMDLDVTGAAAGLVFDEGTLAATKVKLEERLASDRLKAIDAEYLAVERRRQYPKWYSLFGGPKHLRELSRQLGYGVWYEIYYRQWSAAAHVENRLEKLGVDGKGVGRIPEMRDPTEVQHRVSIGATMAILTFYKVLTTLLPARVPDYMKWYAAIRPDYRRISDESPLIRNAIDSPPVP